jgi:hypothetical protein
MSVTRPWNNILYLGEIFLLSQRKNIMSQLQRISIQDFWDLDFEFLNGDDNLLFGTHESLKNF